MFHEPIPAKMDGSGEPVLLLGLADAYHIVYVRDDGRLEVGTVSWFITDYRYNPEYKTWDDAEAAEPESDLDKEGE